MNHQEHNTTFITTRFGDDVIYEVNRRTFDTLDSNTFYEKHYADLFSRPDTLFVILGTDSGLLIRWIAQSQRAPGSRYLFVELPELIEPIRQRYGELIQESGFALTTADNWLGLREDFRFSDYAYLGNFEIVSSVAVRDANLSAYPLLESEMACKAGDFKRDIQQQLGSYPFIRRQIENIADNLVPASLLKNTRVGETAVILGGGPSLDQILPWVERHRERLTVIAVSRIAKRLLNSKVQPDMVVSIDPHPVSFDVSKEALMLPYHPLLVCSNYVSPLVLGQWPGPAVYRGDRFPWKSPEDKGNLLNSGPTVTNQAIAMAMDMGFEQVILGGVDLCFSPQGYTHASGSTEHQAGPRLGQVGNQVETYGGGIAETDGPFRQAIKIMGAQAAQAQERGCTLINPFADAAKVEHVQHIPLEALNVSDWPASDMARDLKTLLKPQQQLREKTLACGGKELLNARGQLHQIRKLCKEALECNDKLCGRAGEDGDFRYKKRMDRIERKLDRDYARFTPLIKQLAAGGFLSLLRPDKEHEWSDDEIREWGRSYYEIYIRAIDELEQMITASRERLACRQEEIQKQPDFERLLTQWRQDDNPVRAINFEREHPELLAQADPAIRQAFAELQKQFQHALSKTDTQQEKVIRSYYTNAKVRSKLLLQFREKNQEKLTHMAQNLLDQEGGEARELAELAQGFLAELQQDHAQAMSHYQAIIDLAAERLARDNEQTMSPGVEDALRRMSFISLEQQDIQTALLSLDALSLASPVYQPQYAEALRIAGHLQEAVNVYTDYLQKVPNDLATMLKLGQLLQNAGAIQAARESYNYVLSHAPDNRVAQNMLNSLATAQPSA